MYTHVLTTERERGAALKLVDALSQTEGFAPVGERSLMGLTDASATVIGANEAGRLEGVAVVVPGAPPTLEIAVPRGADRIARHLVEEVVRAHPHLRAWAMRDVWGAQLLSSGFTVDRVLHRMEVTLPVERPAIALTVRGFRAGDAPALIDVNSAAFAGHPEQAGLTEEDVERKRTMEWWDPDGIRLAWDGERLAGFCWTKVHSGSVGEIYVIGLHPDYHGRGWGRALTLEGLRYLAEQRACRTGMLHVDAANEAAMATYQEIGFRTVSTDRAYVRESVEDSLDA